MSLRLTVLLAMGWLVGVACRKPVEVGPDLVLDTAVLVTDSALFFENGVQLWNGATTSNTNPLGTRAVIPVCWVQAPRTSSADDDAKCDYATSTRDCLGTSFASTTGTFTGSATAVRDALRSHVRQAVEGTWMAVANIELRGWNACPLRNGLHKQSALDGYLAIQFSTLAPDGQSCAGRNHTCAYQRHCDAGSKTCRSDRVDWSGLGKPSRGPTVMQLNWKTINDPASGNNRFNILHEFGHALGFSHEWMRRDWTLPESSTFSDDGNVEGNVLGTATNDTLSIMDYSDTVQPSELSAWDIMGVQWAYGRNDRSNQASTRLPWDSYFRGASNDGCTNAASASGTHPFSSWGRSATWELELFDDRALASPGVEPFAREWVLENTLVELSAAACSVIVPWVIRAPQRLTFRVVLQP